MSLKSKVQHVAIRSISRDLIAAELLSCQRPTVNAVKNLNDFGHQLAEISPIWPKIQPFLTTRHCMHHTWSGLSDLYARLWLQTTNFSHFSTIRGPKFGHQQAITWTNVDPVLCCLRVSSYNKTTMSSTFLLIIHCPFIWNQQNPFCNKTFTSSTSLAAFCLNSSLLYTSKKW